MSEGKEDGELQGSSQWKPVINLKKRPACVANGNGECLMLPGPSKVLKAPEGRFADTVMSLEVIGADSSFGRRDTDYQRRRNVMEDVHPRDDFDPVMPSVIAEEVIIDVDSVGKSPLRPSSPSLVPVRRTVMVHRPRLPQYQFVKQLNEELRSENAKLKDQNLRLRLALEERGLRIKDILAENARYCVMFKNLEKEFGVDAVKDVIDKIKPPII